MNTVDIDPKGTSTDVEFESTSAQVAPRVGFGGDAEVQDGERAGGIDSRAETGW